MSSDVSSSPKSVLSSVLLTVVFNTVSIVKKLSEESWVSVRMLSYWEVLYMFSELLLKVFFVTLPSVPEDLR